MGHNPPYREGIYHQSISIVECNTSLRGLEKTPTILDHNVPTYLHISLVETRQKRQEGKIRK